MDGLTLLSDAEKAGLRVEAEGGRLRIRGPRRAESLALRLIQHKADVLAVLSQTIGPSVGDLPPDWRLEFEERAAIREYDGGQCREYAEAEALREIVARMRASGIV